MNPEKFVMGVILLSVIATIDFCFVALLGSDVGWILKVPFALLTFAANCAFLFSLSDEIKRG